MAGRAWWWVGGLAAVALALRLAQLDQSLFGDELYLYAIVTRPDLGDVLGEVHDTESTPPLHFLITWLAAKVVDPPTAVRIPSVVASVATVPATFALGRRAVGERAALLAAAVIAVAPFSVFYGVESRAYALLGLLSALSTLALLRALEGPRWTRWALFGGLTLAILYTHYTGVFVVVAQGGWAAWRHRARLRELALTYAAVALAYVPWIPSLLVQRRDSAADRIEFIYHLTVESVARGLLTVLPGHPFNTLRVLPGRPLAAAFVVAVAAAVVLALVRRRRGPASPSARRATELLLVVALATPVGAVLYSLGPESVYLPRNLVASLPAAALLLGLAVVRSGRVAAPLLAAVVLGVLAVGTARTFDPDRARVDYQAAAEFIERHGRPGDPVMEVSVHPTSPLGLALDIYLDDGHPLARERRDFTRMAAAGRRSGQLFVVVPQAGVLTGLPRLAELEGYSLIDVGRFRGLVPVRVFVYRPQRAGRGDPR